MIAQSRILRIKAFLIIVWKLYLRGIRESSSIEAKLKSGTLRIFQPSSI
jgi:hypothetical protein